MRRKIGAYAVCRDRSGRLLLVRASDRSVRPGCWSLPGGGVDHGEQPAAAVLRELTEETGLTGEIVGVRDVVAEVISRPPFLEHTDGVIYDVVVTGGELRPEPDGTTDEPRWLTPQQAAGLPLSQFAAYALGVPAPEQRYPSDPATAAAPVEWAHARQVPPASGRGQRFAVYGLVTDRADRVLLTEVSAGYPGAGLWHLPGGGSDFGEQPRDALGREIIEESGQHGRIGALLAVADHRDPAALGRQGRRIDWHAVRAVFQVTVDEPTRPRVVDAGGSTARAGWFTRTEAAELPLTAPAAGLLATRPDGSAEPLPRGRR